MSHSSLRLSVCPRCKERGLEFLESVVTCHGCNLSIEQDPISNFQGEAIAQIPDWVLEALNEIPTQRLITKSKPRVAFDLLPYLNPNPHVA